MTELCNSIEKSTDVFNPLSFERKLVELVEELRLKRNLEMESEKTIKSVMDEKYREELCWEEQQRRNVREKEDLEQQIGLLKRKLEDKVCVSDDDKAKQQLMNKTYSHEIRMLKEELRVSKSEKLNLQKKIQELEGKLNLHRNFQESIMSQTSDVRKMIKSALEESQQLAAAQKTVMENVNSAKSMFKKVDLCNQHLQQSMLIVGKKSEALQKELISSRSEYTILKNSIPTEKENNNNDLELEKLRTTVLDLQKLLLSSRKENEKTLSNFLESNKLLCKFMDKYSEIQEKEKHLTKELEEQQEKLDKTEKELQETQDIMKKKDELEVLKEKERIENQCSVGIQTELNFRECYFCSKGIVPSISAAASQLTLNSDLPKEVHEEDFDKEIKRLNCLMDLQNNAVVTHSENAEIQQNAVVRQSSMKNDFPNFIADHLSISSKDKEITVCEVLKRKLEIMESGDKIELISLKRSFTENTIAPIIDIKKGDGDMKKLASSLSNNVQEPDFSKDKSFDILMNHKLLASHEMLTDKLEEDSKNCQVIKKFH